MTDHELLLLCAQAFEATLTSKESRRFLKKLGFTPESYSGHGQHILAQHMAGKITAHLMAAGYGQKPTPAPAKERGIRYDSMADYTRE